MMERHLAPSAKAVPYGLILALNYFSLVFLLGGVLICYRITANVISAVACFVLWYYLVPPLLCRLTLVFCARPRGIVGPDSTSHTLWWWLYQLQLPVSRFPASEELLRVVPGLYALWLNLWGGRVSVFAFWSPGVIVQDRYHLQVGKGVILGAKSFLSGHVMQKQPDGSTLLYVDEIRLDEGAMVGARANLSPGCHIHANQAVPFNAVYRPYTELKDGRKTRMREHDPGG